MVDLISGLIWLAIIAAFITPWIRAAIQRRNVPAGGRRPIAGPRDLAESGGYEPPAPVGRMQEGGRQREQEQPREETLVRRQAQQQRQVAEEAATEQARSVRRALSTPRAAQQAFVMMEVLGRPVSMREESRSPNGTHS